MGARVHVNALGREAAAHRVFADRARLKELQQVVGPAGLVADATELEAAERVPADDGAGGLAVDVQVAGPEGRTNSESIAISTASSKVRAWKTLSTGPNISSRAKGSPRFTSTKTVGAM